MTPLSPDFLTIPIAHRGLHDRAANRPENSRAAFAAAIEAGYGIELDVQPARDGVPMVFHDYTLDRMTGVSGPVTGRDAAELARLTLLQTRETIPTLAEVACLVAGQVPLLVEIKDQPGDPQCATDRLTEAVIDALAEYPGPLAVMSFNPFAVAHGAGLAPGWAWGLTTANRRPLWPDHPALEAATLGNATDPRVRGCSFISHGSHDAGAPWLPALAATGIDILSWTIRTPEEEALARRFARNITFEGYRPALPQRGA